VIVNIIPTSKIGQNRLKSISQSKFLLYIKEMEWKYNHRY